MWLLVLALGALLSGDDDARRPKALVLLQEHRQALQTARVEFRRRNMQVDADWAHYAARVAGPDLASENLGDSNGVVLGNEAPQGRRHAFLLSSGATFSHENDAPLANYSGPDEPRHERFWDMRSLGTSFYPWYDDLDRVLWMDGTVQPAARRYEETVEGGLHVVSCQCDHGLIKWWIDPKKGWSATRVTLESDGKVVRESRTSLRQWGECWYPERVEFFTLDYRDGKEPFHVFEITSAAFNEPNAPQRLRPADIGIEPGWLLRRGPASANRATPESWDGAKPVSLEEFTRRVQSGEVRYGQSVLEYARTHSAAIQSNPGAAGGEVGADHEPNREAAWALYPTCRAYVQLWEDYTRDFIARYELDATKAASAWRFHRDCLSRALEYVERERVAFLDLEGRLRKPETERSQEDRQQIAERTERLFRPIQEIERSQLKPRLHKLPTREQEKRAAARAVDSKKP